MEIKKLSKQNHAEVVALFGEDLVYYHFLVDDLLDNDYGGEAFHVYGEYDKANLSSILLNNYENITYYARTDRSVDVYRDILGQLRFSKLSGPSHLMAKFLPFVEATADTLSYLGVVEDIKVQRSYPELVVNTISTAEEVGRQYDLLMSTEEYNLGQDRDTYVQAEMRRLEGTNARTVYLSRDGQMIASCATTRESRNSAIIIGVVTDPEYRNQGYGTEVLVDLFAALLREGKYPYLFYNNPAARSVYKNLGMTEVCQWRVVSVSR